MGVSLDIAGENSGRLVRAYVRWALILALSCAFALCGCSAGAPVGATGSVGSSSEAVMPIVKEATVSSEGTGENGAAAAGENGAAAAGAKAAAGASDVTLLAAGDVVVHGPVWKSGLRGDGSYNFDHLFAHVKSETQAADVALISQETILGGTGLGLSGYPCFNGPQELGDAEVNAGYDVIVKASNHALDKGAAGIAAELSFWRTKHPAIAVVGIADSEESYNKIYVYQQGGLKVAMLSYTYGTNGIALPSSNPYATHYLDDDQVTSDVRRAQKLADLVVVWPHWGTEYQTSPDDLQQHYAQLFCDLGVDVVIGSHPHCLGPVEVKQNGEGHKTLVFYSLGNFISNQTKGPLTSVGAEVTLGLSKDAHGAHVDSWRLIPTVTQRASGTGFTVYRLADYTDELAAANQTSLTRQDCIDVCTKALGEGFDPQTCALAGTL